MSPIEEIVADRKIQKIENDISDLLDTDLSSQLNFKSYDSDSISDLQELHDWYQGVRMNMGKISCSNLPDLIFDLKQAVKERYAT